MMRGPVADEAMAIVKKVSALVREAAGGTATTGDDDAAAGRTGPPAAAPAAPAPAAVHAKKRTAAAAAAAKTPADRSSSEASSSSRTTTTTTRKFPVVKKGDPTWHKWPAEIHSDPDATQPLSIYHWYGHYVRCSLCQMDVKLSHKYNLSAWRKHKECQRHRALKLGVDVKSLRNKRKDAGKKKGSEKKGGGEKEIGGSEKSGASTKQQQKQSKGGPSDGGGEEGKAEEGGGGGDGADGSAGAHAGQDAPDETANAETGADADAEADGETITNGMDPATRSRFYGDILKHFQTLAARTLREGTEAARQGKLVGIDREKKLRDVVEALGEAFPEVDLAISAAASTTGGERSGGSDQGDDGMTELERKYFAATEAEKAKSSAGSGRKRKKPPLDPEYKAAMSELRKKARKEKASFQKKIQSLERRVEKFEGEKQAEKEGEKERKAQWHANRIKSWDNRFEELRQFKETFGHTNVPKSYENKSLVNWVGKQREKLYRQVRDGKRTKTPEMEERIAKLDDLGFRWRSSKAHLTTP